MTPGSRWLVSHPACGSKRGQLFCCSHAGVSAAVFRGWRNCLPPGIETCAIQLPGRMERFRERPLARMDELIAALIQAIDDRLDVPYVIFGHCTGALTAFELARALTEQGYPCPAHLIVSGSRAPHQQPESMLHDQPDEQLMDYLAKNDDAVLNIVSKPHLAAILLTAFRADLELAENYCYHGRKLFTGPLTVLAGRDDSHMDSVTREAWRQISGGSFTLMEIDGAHNLFAGCSASLMSAVCTVLDQALPAAALQPIQSDSITPLLKG